MKVEFFQGESLIGQSWKTLDSISLEIVMYFLRKSADLWREIQISSNLQNWHFITKEKMLKLKTSMQAWSLQFVIYFNTFSGPLWNPLCPNCDLPSELLFWHFSSLIFQNSPFFFQFGWQKLILNWFHEFVNHP